MGIFSNGSAVSAPMSTKPTSAPAPVQPRDAYMRQVYGDLDASDAKLRRDIARDAAGERVRAMAISGSWPSWMPEGVKGAVNAALSAEAQARGAFRAAEQAADMWQRDHPTASDELRRVKYEELTIEQATQGDRAVKALGQVLAQAGEMLETLETQLAIITGDAAERAAEERRHEQATQAQDTRVLLARQIAARFGVTL